MALMRESVDIEPYYFEEEIQKPIWVDAMVDEYESISRNSAWEVVPTLEEKIVVGSKWIYKVT